MWNLDLKKKKRYKCKRGGLIASGSQREDEIRESEGEVNIVKVLQMHV
jgi:hypothetical protein